MTYIGLTSKYQPVGLYNFIIFLLLVIDFIEYRKIEVRNPCERFTLKLITMILYHENVNEKGTIYLDCIECSLSLSSLSIFFFLSFFLLFYSKILIRSRNFGTINRSTCHSEYWKSWISFHSKLHIRPKVTWKYIIRRCVSLNKIGGWKFSQ